MSILWGCGGGDFLVPKDASSLKTKHNEASLQVLLNVSIFTDFRKKRGGTKINRCTCNIVIK